MKPSNYENKNSNYNNNNKQEQTNTTTRVENCYPNNKNNTFKSVRAVTALKSMLQKTGNEMHAVAHGRSSLIFPCHAAYTSYNYNA